MNDDINSFQKSFRAIVSNDLVKVYNEKSYIPVDSSISFDSEKEEFTSIDFFVSSIVSELILTMMRVAKKRNTILQDIEAKVNLDIDNPMYLLNVIGFEDKSIINKIDIDIYFFSFYEGEELQEFLDEVLNRTLIYNSIKDLVNVNFKTVL
ncbi:osmotically inducible protein C [Finegoldia magna]|uniref:OsmC family protein n=1 Tax=Finegoldia magna TaxID=1260 RepID=UPI000B91607F|nr:OsmC family protein [Finegoldia magna]MDU5808983.1 OsmC family protein [Finegoldia magna]OXZ31319.1 osmotically inducible protein C [Finegoldia magna]